MKKKLNLRGLKLNAKPLSILVTSMSVKFTDQYEWNSSYQYGLEILKDGWEHTHTHIYNVCNV